MGAINKTAALICLHMSGFCIIILNFGALIITVKSRKRRKLFSYPLSWLLVSNVLIGLFPMQFYGLKKYEFSSQKISTAVCSTWRYNYFTFTHISLVTLLLMTIDKVVTLRRSLSDHTTIAGHRINCLYTISWFFFIIFDAFPFPPIFTTDDEGYHYAVIKDWALTMNILTMIIPFPIIVVSYIYMLVVACRQMKEISRQDFIKNKWSNKTDKIKNALESKATKQVFYIVGTYVLCCLPSFWYYLLTWLCRKCFSNEYKPHRTWIRFFFKLLITFHAAQKMKFSIKDFFSKCEQIRSFLQIWSHLLKKSLMENFAFLCSVIHL